MTYARLMDDIISTVYNDGVDGEHNYYVTWSIKLYVGDDVKVKRSNNMRITLPKFRSDSTV